MSAYSPSSRNITARRFLSWFVSDNIAGIFQGTTLLPLGGECFPDVTCPESVPRAASPPQGEEPRGGFCTDGRFLTLFHLIIPPVESRLLFSPKERETLGWLHLPSAPPEIWEVGPAWPPESPRSAAARCPSPTPDCPLVATSERGAGWFLASLCPGSGLVRPPSSPLPTVAQAPWPHLCQNTTCPSSPQPPHAFEPQCCQKAAPQAKPFQPPWQASPLLHALHGALPRPPSSS